MRTLNQRPLLPVPALLLDHDLAADDTPVEFVQPVCVLTDACVERRRMRHVPNGDLNRALHASASS